MNQTIERLNLLSALNQFNLPLQQLSGYGYEALRNLADALISSDISKEYYRSCRFFPCIIKEMIEDNGFIQYLKSFPIEKMSAVENLIRELQKRRLQATCFTQESYTYVMEYLNHYILAADMLQYFDISSFTKEQQYSILHQNLVWFHKQTKVQLSDLSPDEKELFYKLDLTYVPLKGMDVVLKYLSDDTFLQNILMQMQIILTAEDYNRIIDDSKPIAEGLTKIREILDSDDFNDFTLFKSFCNRWAENGCTLHDILAIIKLFPTLNAERQIHVFDNRASYINLVYGDHYKSIPLTSLSGNHEAIIIYAISHKKRHFLSLVESDLSLFQSIPKDSILFVSRLYNDYLNINELNKANLLEFATMKGHFFWDSLQDRNYTFEEIKQLYKSGGRVYYEFYHMLHLTRVDDRLLVLRELVNKDLLNSRMDQNTIQTLADRLSECPLSKWTERYFKHIDGVSEQEVLQAILCFHEIERFLPQVDSVIQLRFLTRNTQCISPYENFDDVLLHISTFDKDWAELCGKLELGFLDDKQKIQEFILNGNAQVSLKYLNNLKYNAPESYAVQLEGFKRVVIAELRGELQKLKYFEDDLSKELCYPVSAQQKTVWKEDSKLQKLNITVEEHADFFHTMSLGEMPQHTCLSYLDGSHVECLLACFDSNKKFLFAKMNHIICCRAAIRLTKCSDTLNNEGSLEFADLSKKGKKKTGQEKMVLFLEMPYFKHVTEKEEVDICKLLVEIAQEKAQLLNAALVLSHAYSAYEIKGGYVRSRLNIYISKSKAGVQYLDSLDGVEEIRDEGGYKSGTFLIQQSL